MRDDSAEWTDERGALCSGGADADQAGARKLEPPNGQRAAQRSGSACPLLADCYLAFRTLWIATAALVAAAAAPTTAAICFAAFFIRATFRLRCCFLSVSETALLAALVKSDAARVALDAIRLAFFAVFCSRVFVFISRTSGVVSA